ncbi:outer membrane beta-barrel family protein [Flavobacterium oreochromis]|uniref:Outer membrane beta-barrel family protein n=1 Tax=Flavobacterium oreochromis TaxID=2906078 RepID=A0ABW8PAG9_9FLAO|nr:outer membrane beta-barrel family protein [Flavobacterium oreochromis]
MHHSFILLFLFLGMKLVGQEIKKDSTKTIQEIQISKKRKLIEKKIDRVEFVISPANESNTVWDILKKSQGVIAKGDNLTVKGKSVKITINDKVVSLSGEELQSFLENMKGEELKKIEIIENPPARYDAQNGAIINLKTRKLFNNGYKGSIGGTYTQAIYHRKSLNANLYLKHNKWNFSSSYSVANGSNYRTSNDYAIYEEQKVTWKTNLKRRVLFDAKQNLRFVSEYEIDSLNTISAEYTGFINNKNAGIFIVPTEIYDNQSGLIKGNIVTVNKTDLPVMNQTINLSFDKKLKNKAILNTLVSGTLYKMNESQDVSTDFNLDKTQTVKSYFETVNKKEIKLFSFQMDYTLNTFEAGIKYNKNKANTNLIFLEKVNDDLVLQSTNSSDFKYNEKNYAGYITYAKKWTKWEIKAGLRAETTNVSSNVNNQQILDTTYTRIFPTLYIQYKKNDSNTISFSYSNRIDRPNYSWFNPAKLYYNKFSYFVGDAKLQPSFTDNFTLGYSYKEKYNFEFFYFYIKQPFTEINYQYPDNTIVYRFTNINNTNQAGISFSFDQNISNILNSSVYLQGEYKQDAFYGIDKSLYKQDVFTYYINLSNQIVISEKNNFNAEFNFWYTSASVQGTLRLGSQASFNGSLNKKFLDKKLDLSLHFNDWFASEKQIIKVKYANQNNGFTDYIDSRLIRIGIKYNFGNQKLKNKDSKKESDEQKRL